MAGKKGMNKGNMNAVRHPHKVFLRRRVVPDGYGWALRLGENCMGRIKSDLPDMSGKQELVAEGVNMLWTCALLGLAEAKERGFITAKADGTWDFQEGMKTAAGFIDKAIKGLVALGLERKAKLLNGGTLAEQLAQLRHEQQQESP
jgi:hypothetical protein